MRMFEGRDVAKLQQRGRRRKSEAREIETMGAHARRRRKRAAPPAEPSKAKAEK